MRPARSCEYADSAPGVRNPYQLATIVVRDAASGAELARATVVAPVSSEMHCETCHADGSDAAPDIATGKWETNVLALHDRLEAGKYPGTLLRAPPWTAAAWLAEEGAIAPLLPITVYRGTTVTTASGALALLRDWISGNADKALRAELLAAKQNLASGAQGGCVAATVADAENLLEAFYGRNPTVPLALLRADAAALATFNAKGCR